MDTVRLPDASSAVAAVSNRYGNKMEDKVFFEPPLPPPTHTQKNMHKNTHPHCDVTGISYTAATPVCFITSNRDDATNDGKTTHTHTQAHTAALSLSVWLILTWAACSRAAVSSRRLRDAMLLTEATHTL